MSEPEDVRQVRRDFDAAVTMAPAELERWLQTDESRSVGQEDRGGGESTGHAAGRRIVQIKRTKVADLTPDDYAHMRKVVGYWPGTPSSGRTATSPTRPGGTAC